MTCSIRIQGYAVFLEAIYHEKSLIFVVQLPINIMIEDFAVQVAAKLPGYSFYTEQKLNFR